MLMPPPCHADALRHLLLLITPPFHAYATPPLLYMPYTITITLYERLDAILLPPFSALSYARWIYAMPPCRIFADTLFTLMPPRYYSYAITLTLIRLFVLRRYLRR